MSNSLTPDGVFICQLTGCQVQRGAEERGQLVQNILHAASAPPYCAAAWQALLLGYIQMTYASITAAQNSTLLLF